MKYSLKPKPACIQQQAAQQAITCNIGSSSTTTPQHLLAMCRTLSHYATDGPGHQPPLRAGQLLGLSCEGNLSFHANTCACHRLNIKTNINSLRLKGWITAVDNLLINLICSCSVYPLQGSDSTDCR